MQINNHITPSSLGQGARPDHAGGANGRGQQFQAVAEAVEPAATTDTTDAVAPVEETEETTGPGKSGQSPAHLARAQSDLQGSHNFGWLVSQIARGPSIEADTPAEGDGADGAVVATDVVEEGEEAPVGDETAGAGETPVPVPPEEEDPLAGLLDALAEESTIVEETIDPVADPVVDLVDELLDDNDDGSEVT
jgi:hypothetical protein